MADRNRHDACTSRHCCNVDDFGWQLRLLDPFVFRVRQPEIMQRFGDIEERREVLSDFGDSRFFVGKWAHRSPSFRFTILHPQRKCPAKTVERFRRSSWGILQHSSNYRLTVCLFTALRPLAQVRVPSVTTIPYSLPVRAAAHSSSSEHIVAAVVAHEIVLRRPGVHTRCRRYR